MHEEIERKYLINLDKLPFDLKALPYREIEQCYLVWNDSGEEVRIRNIGNEFKFTYKKGEGVYRLEIEVDITQEQYNALKPGTEGKRLRKTRYYLQMEKFKIEIDVYKGRREGLVVAEIEFDSVDDYNSFVPPVWFGEEMTQVESLRNRNLAVE